MHQVPVSVTPPPKPSQQRGFVDVRQCLIRIEFRIDATRHDLFEIRPRFRGGADRRAPTGPTIAHQQAIACRVRIVGIGDELISCGIPPVDQGEYELYGGTVA